MFKVIFEAMLQRVEAQNEEIYLEVSTFEESVPKYDQEFLENEELKVLSEKFTTYRERLKASDHMEIDDVGSDGGEFTLF